MHLNIAVFHVSEIREEKNLKIYSFVGFLYKHSLVTKLLTRAAAAARKGAPSTRIKYASRRHALKIRQATSGIMRGLSLMCESRVLPLCVANEGKHVRKGWLFT